MIVVIGIVLALLILFVPGGALLIKERQKAVREAFSKGVGRWQFAEHGR